MSRAANWRATRRRCQEVQPGEVDGSLLLPIFSFGRFARWFFDRRLGSDRLYNALFWTRTRTWFALLFFILHPSSFILSQEAPASTPKPGARLMFVPPPMEGTISMGIYDGAGKLVRALHREEEVQSDVFGKALNGLITSWDGRNDAGETMPAGKYFARGFMVGEIGTEGEAMHGNDFIVDDDSTRVRRILKIGTNEQGLLKTVYGKVSGWGAFTSAESGPVSPPPGIVTAVTEGRLVLKSGTTEKTVQLAPGEAALDASPGYGDIAWVIVSTGSTREVRAYSSEGEFIRRLTYAPDEPPAVSIKASPKDATIHLLDENQAMQRVRTLKLIIPPDTIQTTGSGLASGTETFASPAPTGPATTSTWKVLFTKTITFSDTLDQARGLLKFPDGKPFEPQDKIRVSLLPNPLVQDQPGSVEISAGIDAEGSFLKTADGLLLKRISDTPNLKWSVLGRESGSKSIVLFQSDGAVVEEYRVMRPANMMAFDCGDFEFDPAKLR